MARRVMRTGRGQNRGPVIVSPTSLENTRMNARVAPASAMSLLKLDHLHLPGRAVALLPEGVHEDGRREQEDEKEDRPEVRQMPV